MVSREVTPPLVVIVGPTASGKSDLAMEAARRVGGEIIAADSRTIYKGMDIGTAKPSEQDRAEIAHHLIDVVEPGARFTAADFQKQAIAAIQSIWARGHVPIMVGGTGLYVDSVIFGYQFGGDADKSLRSKLNSMGVAELQAYCAEHNVLLPGDVKNKRRLIRAIERGGANRKRNGELRPHTLVVGISTSREVLRKRITLRAERMFNSGVVDEASTLADKYGWESEAMTGSIYRIVRKMLDGQIDQSQALGQFITADTQLAKRQMTWFKRNPHIVWSDDKAELLSRIVDFAKQYSIQ